MPKSEDDLVPTPDEGPKPTDRVTAVYTDEAGTVESVCVRDFYEEFLEPHGWVLKEE